MKKQQRLPQSSALNIFGREDYDGGRLRVEIFSIS